MAVRRMLALMSVGAMLLEPPSVRADPVAIVDTLGGVSTGTQFSIFGSTGLPFFGLHSFGTEFVGPEFTLDQPAVLTSVGGFVNSCESILGGVPQCVPASPITVQIRPAIGQVPDAGPDPDRIIASFVLSHDDEPVTVSFESATFELPLPAGTYYALFTLPPGEGGDILIAAQRPFVFSAGSATFGALDPATNFSGSFVSEGAVRVTASPVPEPSTLSLLVAGSAIAGAVRRRLARMNRPAFRREDHA